MMVGGAQRSAGRKLQCVPTDHRDLTRLQWHGQPVWSVPDLCT